MLQYSIKLQYSAHIANYNSTLQYNKYYLVTNNQ